MSLARIVPIDPSEEIGLTAVRCTACHRGTQVYRDDSETRCVHCDGSGWLPNCPHCGGDEEVEAWNHTAGDYETARCRCVVEADEPVSLAAD